MQCPKKRILVSRGNHGPLYAAARTPKIVRNGHGGGGREKWEVLVLVSIYKDECGQGGAAAYLVVVQVRYSIPERDSLAQIILAFGRCCITNTTTEERIILPWGHLAQTRLFESFSIP